MPLIPESTRELVTPLAIASSTSPPFAAAIIPEPIPLIVALAIAGLSLKNLPASAKGPVSPAAPVSALSKTDPPTSAPALIKPRSKTAPTSPPLAPATVAAATVLLTALAAAVATLAGTSKPLNAFVTASFSPTADSPDEIPAVTAPRIAPSRKSPPLTSAKSPFVIAALAIAVPVAPKPKVVAAVVAIVGMADKVTPA